MLVVDGEVVVEVVGVNAGGDTVAEHDAMRRQMPGATRAALSLRIRRPISTLTGKPPLSSCNQRA
jgi:hypothetical protein